MTGPTPGSALVLGGGGVSGIAWEIGLLCGLRERGLDLTTSDLLVGTSAGSFVGAQVAWGTPLEALLAAELEPADPVRDQLTAPMGPPFLRRLVPLSERRGLGWLPNAWLSMRLGRTAFRYLRTRDRTAPRPPLPVGLAQAAVGLRTNTEARSLAWFRHTVPGRGAWPERDLVITTIDLASGRLVAWDRHAHEPLPDVVAASCALPGVLPPITLRGRAHVDGGLYSALNATLAASSASVVVVAPILRHPEQRDLERLRATGTDVRLLVPDAASRAAIGRGIELMDVRRRRRAALAGLDQGRRIAAEAKPSSAVTAPA